MLNFILKLLKPVDTLCYMGDVYDVLTRTCDGLQGYDGFLLHHPSEFYNKTYVKGNAASNL